MNEAKESMCLCQCLPICSELFASILLMTLQNLEVITFLFCLEISRLLCDIVHGHTQTIPCFYSATTSSNHDEIVLPVIVIISSLHHRIG